MGLAKPQSLLVGRDHETLPTTCTECGSTLVEDAFRGEYSCVECGLVNEEKAVEDKGRPSYTLEQYRKRTTHEPLNMFGHVLGPSQAKTPLQKKAEKHLRKANQWQRFVPETVVRGTVTIKTIAHTYHVPDIIAEFAEKLYKRAQEDSLLKNNSVTSLSTACFYYSCKKHARAINLSDLREHSELTERQFNRSYKALVEAYGQVRVLAPAAFVPEVVHGVCDTWNLEAEAKDTASTKVESEAIRLLSDYYHAMRRKGVFPGVDPRGMANTAVYYTANTLGYKTTQKDVSAVYRITEVTLRSRLKDIVEGLGLEPLEKRTRGVKSKDS